ncbi:MAG TPA: S41 family peptidase [Stellaceae bacterium]|nr:S41 family peptidase [Stellaceae bacterium]
MSLEELRHTAVRIGAVALLTAALYGCGSAGAGARTAADDPGLGFIGQVMDQVQNSYVAPVTKHELVEDALRGMLTRLDPHSDYMDQQQYRQMAAVTRGQFGGIGIELTLEGRIPQVISPIDGTPAARAGIEPGDRIIKIDGQATDGMDVEQIVKRLRGAPGTRVTLTILRTNQPSFAVSLTRRIIHVVSVKSALEPGRIGYVRITTFTENTPAELAAALARLKQQAHGRLDGFILDLRNDPGGLLDSAVDVAGDFLNGGVVVTTRGRNPDDDHTFNAPETGDLLPRVPMVALVNSASASAAEIVAGALQDHRRATVMGTRTFGKGSVQSIIPMDGYGALRLTTALYYTPSGRSLQGQGITPNITVPVPQDEQVANAVVTYESDLYGALKNGGSLGGTGARPAAGTDNAANDHPIKPLLIGTRRDAQLEAAIAYLHRAVREAAGPHPG